MTKRFPHDYSWKELADLVLYHHQQHVETATKLTQTRDKLIEAQKELSRLKRQK